jgi:phosphoribosylamine--glycine ligase
MSAYNVLAIDQSGRGHALCDLLTRSRPDVAVHYGPGSRAAASERIRIVPRIDLEDPATAVEAARATSPDLIIVGTIEALRAGVADALRADGWPTIGASRAASRLETSKRFAKEFLVRHGVRTPVCRHYDSPETALAELGNFPERYVIKADGLCLAGDGVKMVESRAEARDAITALMHQRQLGDAGAEVLIEERVAGSELSLMVFLDAEGGYRMLPPALDYKRSDEGNTGINCAGMGTVFPHPLHNAELMTELETEVVRPIVRGIHAEGLSFTGFLFIGAMLTSSGVTVLEINSRFGDSEAEVVYPSMQSDFCACCMDGLNGDANAVEWDFDGLVRVSVSLGQGPVRATNAVNVGWPHGGFVAGNRISGLDAIDRDRCDIFYSAMDLDDEGHRVTAGGRVAHVVGKGRTTLEAARNAYAGVDCVAFDGMTFRRDIGLCL